VLLLDEVEKASPYLMNLFLQAFDEGWLTDGAARRFICLTRL
jgi:ATP-dependent Clp protease ATP-binding subunit ClpA